MPTETTEKKEVKRENFATVAEAIAGAGTTVLSRLSTAEINRAARPNEEEVKQHLEENQGWVLGPASPYDDETDARNLWTKYQDNPEEAPTSPKQQRELKEKQDAELAEALEAARGEREERSLEESQVDSRRRHRELK